MSLITSTDPTKTTASPSQNRYLGFWFWHLVPMVILIFVAIPHSYWIPFPHEGLVSYTHYMKYEEASVPLIAYKDLCFIQAQCQIGMVGAWLIWGAGHWFKRIVLTLGLLAWMYIPFLIVIFFSWHFDFYLTVYSPFIFYVAKPFGIAIFAEGALSLMGWRIPPQSSAETSTATSQFSLRQLLWALLIVPAVMGGVAYLGLRYLKETQVRTDPLISIEVGGWNILIAMPVSLLLMGLILSGKSYLWRIGWVLLITVILVTIGSGVLVRAEGKELFQTRAIDSLCLLIGAEIVFYGISWCWLRKANLAFARTSLPKM